MSSAAGACSATGRWSTLLGGGPAVLDDIEEPRSPAKKPIDSRTTKRKDPFCAIDSDFRWKVANDVFVSVIRQHRHDGGVLSWKLKIQRASYRIQDSDGFLWPFLGRLLHS